LRNSASAPKGIGRCVDEVREFTDALAGSSDNTLLLFAHEYAPLLLLEEAESIESYVRLSCGLCSFMRMQFDDTS